MHFNQVHCTQTSYSLSICHKRYQTALKCISGNYLKGCQQAKKVKYDIDFSIRCPECEEDIRVGTAGPNGLPNHQGKKLCRDTKARKEKQAKTRTLFDIGIQRVVPSQKKTVPSTITTGWDALVVVASSTTPQTSDVQGSNLKTRKGCLSAWRLLGRLREAATTLGPENRRTEGNDELAPYSRESAASTYSMVPNDEIWERVNPTLDRLLGFARPKEELCGIVRASGASGLNGLCGFLEYLVEEKSVVGELLEGKINALLDAIGM